MNVEYGVFVGVDWATQEHQVCALEANGQILGERAFKHAGTGIEELVAWLDGFVAKHGSVAVGIETPHGPVVEALLDHGISVFSLNPKQMDRFRDRFTVAGAKDDRLDARVLADSLRTDRPAFRLLQVQDSLIIELREWSRMLDEIQVERGRLAGRIRQQLWRYFPQMLAVTEDIEADWFLELWKMIPSPAQALRTRPMQVETLLKSRRIRQTDARTVLNKLKEKPLTVAAGTAEAATAHIAALVPRLILLNTQHRDALKQLRTLTDKLAEPTPGQQAEQRDVEILRSLPGVGRIVLATLLAEASEPLRNRDYHALRTLSGIAPITKKSGKSKSVVMRRACSARVRAAVYHWARIAMQRDPVSRERYTQLRARGKTHGRALRGLADRLLSVACAMLRKQTLFKPDLKPLAA
jgi:transposase